jgi:hypothetical protein
MCAWACAIVVPGRSRAKAKKPRLPRDWYRLASERPSAGAAVTGIQTSTSSPGSRPRKPSGATPTTVTGCPFSRTVRPTRAGSPA